MCTLQINTDIYVLHKHQLKRLLERYPAIRHQIMVIAEHRHRLARARERGAGAARRYTAHAAHAAHADVNLTRE